MRDARGQATVDYLAVVLLVALVVGAMAALLATTDLGERVIAAFRRALCVVTGGACDDVAAPCVTSSAEHSEGTRVNALIFRVGQRRVVLRERHPDGTETLTVVRRGEHGLDFGTGVGAQVRWGRFGWAVGAELRAAVLAEQSDGRAWTVQDDAEADRLLRRVTLADLSEHARPSIPGAPSMAPTRLEVQAPEPQETFAEHGGAVALDWQGTGNAHVLAAESYGERVVRATGRRTVYVRAEKSGAGSVSIGGKLSLTAGTGREERYGITYDRSGRPLDFEVLSSFDLAAAAGLPQQLAQAAGGALHGSEHLETEQHLDLTDPASAELVQGFLGAFGTRDGLRVAARLLRRRLDLDGTTRVRAYDTSATAHEVGGQARIGGIGVGGQAGSEDGTQRLVSALVRGADGAWRPDPACA